MFKIMIKGIRFYLKNGDDECYDPIREENFKETEDLYILHNGAYAYEIIKEDVSNYEWYDCCDSCGYELIDYVCKNYGCFKCEVDEDS